MFLIHKNLQRASFLKSSPKRPIRRMSFKRKSRPRRLSLNPQKKKILPLSRNQPRRIEKFLLTESHLFLRIRSKRL